MTKRKTINATDPWMRQALRNIEADYSAVVSPENKRKDLLKFGVNLDVETASATLMTLPDTIDNETYVSTNIITSAVSSSASDGEIITIEGHTISGGVFTFVVQNVTLLGQSAATLGTALARVTRVYNNDTTLLAGTVAIGQTDTYTAGVNDTNTFVHCMIVAGKQNSEKASTTLSDTDYWIVTSMQADMLTKAAAFGEVDLEVRLAGKVFREIDSISCSDNHAGHIDFRPYLIMPANSDVRLVATSDSGTGRAIGGSLHGVLAN